MNSLLTERMKIAAHDFDPDSADPVDGPWVDMSGFDKLLVGFIRTVGTGAIDTFRIIANPQSNGGGTDVVVKTKTMTGIQPDAAFDTSWIEVSAAEVVAAAKATGANLRYVAAQVEFATETDEGILVYILADAKHSKSGVTADVIA